MKKKSSIIKLSIIGLATVIGLVLSFVPISFGLTKFTSFARAVKLGLDLKGGVYAVYEMDEGQSTANLSSRMDGTRTRLQDLLVDKGYTEATVVKDGTQRLRVEVPDVDEPGKIFDIIGKPAELRFELEGNTVITGKNVLSAVADYDTQQGEYVVSLSLDSDGTVKFRDATKAENKDKQISIIITVDGEDSTISSPKINDQIVNGKAVITGMESREAAQNLADQITSGQFDVKLSLLESSTVSPTLGARALMLSIIAGIVGLALVIVFMCLVYKMFGAVASFSLVIYTVLMLFFLAVIPGVQLTLPGIAGILLSIGMAVDANVIIYERIKEEYRGGRSILASYYAGFKKAFWSIFDSNITTVIAGAVLYFFGSGSVKGFAITLLIGIVLSMFMALVVTRSIIKYVLHINSSSEKLYGLKRGKDFENLGADVTDASIAEADAAQKRNKDGKKDGAAGGLANETV
ncbi:MAG: protein translocase subunit SecD [Clostridiales bacterium]|jgi:preprotein translocase subunit SecD|nr:protein translocase subunit SecD [Clostridiales bacterium]